MRCSNAANIFWLFSRQVQLGDLTQAYHFMTNHSTDTQTVQSNQMVQVNPQMAPLQDQYHVWSDSIDHLCPSCHHAAEIVDHFLACPQMDWQQIWKDHHKKLHRHQIKHNLSTIFHDIQAYGLCCQGWQAQTDITMHHLPTNIQALFEAQSYLGWKQLYYGWFTPLWISTIGYHHPQINGKNYMAKSLRLTWQAVLQIWTLGLKYTLTCKQSQTERLQPTTGSSPPSILASWTRPNSARFGQFPHSWSDYDQTNLMHMAVGYQLPQSHASSQKSSQATSSTMNKWHLALL